MLTTAQHMYSGLLKVLYMCIAHCGCCVWSCVRCSCGRPHTQATAKGTLVTHLLLLLHVSFTNVGSKYFCCQFLVFCVYVIW